MVGYTVGCHTREKRVLNQYTARNVSIGAHATTARIAKFRVSNHLTPDCAVAGISGNVMPCVTQMTVG